ncbi:hypothetical protein HWV62_4635, partial [Athelia sp. TMB]
MDWPFDRIWRDSLRKGGKTDFSSLAQNVETFRLGTNVDKYTQGFKQILHDGKIKGGANWSINQKSQVITKFMLLEKIATTLGYPASDRFAEPRKPSKKLIHDKLASVVKAVTYEAIHKHVTGGGSRTNVSLALPDPEHMSDVQLVELRQLTLLLNGSKSQKEAEHLMVEGNLQYLAFMPFPADKTDFFNELLRACEDCCLPQPTVNRLAKMTDADKTGFFTAVTSTLDIAIHISPLAMLARLPGSRFHIRRDVFFEWCQALGPKPAFMKQAEDGMWKMILSIALGQPLSEALASFAVDYNESFQLLRPHQEALRAHFMNGCLKDDKTPISATLPTVTNGDTASGQAHAEEVENGGDSTSQDGASPSQAISSSHVKLRNDSTSKSAAAVTSPHESLDGSANAPSGSSKSNSKGSSKLSENLNTREAVSQDKPPAPPALRRESKAVNK